MKRETCGHYNYCHARYEYLAEGSEGHSRAFYAQQMPFQRVLEAGITPIPEPPYSSEVCHLYFEFLVNEIDHSRYMLECAMWPCDWEGVKKEIESEEPWFCFGSYIDAPELPSLMLTGSNHSGQHDIEPHWINHSFMMDGSILTNLSTREYEKARAVFLPVIGTPNDGWDWPEGWTKFDPLVNENWMEGIPGWVRLGGCWVQTFVEPYFSAFTPSDLCPPAVNEVAPQPEGSWWDSPERLARRFAPSDVYGEAVVKPQEATTEKQPEGVNLVNENLPRIGDTCMVAGANSDKPDGGWHYTEVTVLGYSKNQEFGCFQHGDCWPFVERISDCLFARVPLPSPERPIGSEGPELETHGIPMMSMDDKRELVQSIQKHRLVNENPPVPGCGCPVCWMKTMIQRNTQILDQWECERNNPDGTAS